MKTSTNTPAASKPFPRQSSLLKFCLTLPPLYAVRLLVAGLILIIPPAATTATAATHNPPAPATRVIVIDKAQKHLVLFKNGKQVAEFPASFGIDPDSDKYKAFDCATPEGRYFITHKKNKSPFHRFLGISYPNYVNAEKGLAQEQIGKMEYHRIVEDIRKSKWTSRITGLGCNIGIHGGGVFRSMDHSTERDWTEGCIALNDINIEKLYDWSMPGDPVIIFNSRRNLYGIIRPFTHAATLNRHGVPVCPKACCSYQVEIATAMGLMVFDLKEGKAYGRSIEIMVYPTNLTEKPEIVIIDRNADGFISSLDSVSGVKGQVSHPDNTYQQVRNAVIETLTRGDIAAIEGKN